jgi:anaerobic selenocysteine-containing dehydrogenase
VWNDRASVEVPVRISTRLRPGVVAIPFGWWSAHHPDGKVANSLTNDALTEWGGGVAYSDTLVQIAPAVSDTLQVDGAAGGSSSRRPRTVQS